MNERPTIILIGCPAQREGVVKAALRDVAELRPEPNPLAAVPTARRLGAHIALVDLASDVEQGLRAMQDLRSADGEAQVVALALEKDPDLILQAMRSGACEFVVLDRPGELARVVGDLVRRLAPDEPAGQIVSLFPAKGGMGGTAMATNLAAMLLGGEGEGARRVVIVDLDLQLGDVLVFLDMQSRYTIADVLHHMKRLDRELLFSSVARHGSGVDVLAQSDHLEEADKVQPAKIGALLKFLARNYDYVVVDGLRGFDEMALAALDASNKVLLVLTQDVPSIKNAQRCLDVFRRLSYEPDKVSVVLNRYQKSEKIDLGAIEDNLGVAVSCVVANDYPSVIKAINRGILLADAAPRAKVTEDLRKLAAHVAGERPGRRDGGGFLAGLFGRKRPATKEVRALTVTPPGGTAAVKPEDGSDEPEPTPEAV